MTWYAEVPMVDMDTWMDKTQQNSCISFEVLNASLDIVAQFKACHNPSLLPPIEKPHNLTLCYTQPPRFVPKFRNHSGYLLMAQNIMYHIRHGVDQVVVYINVDHREHAITLLQPFMDRGLAAVIFVDSPNVYQIRNQNDCMNRFKGRTRLYRSMDFDEFMYVPARRSMRAQQMDPDWAESQASLFDALQPSLRSDACWIYLSGYHWAAPPDMSHQLLLDAVYRRNVTQMADYAHEKAIVKPECCAVDWIHFPKVCFSRGYTCKATWGKVVYAHFKDWKPGHFGVHDMFFAKESGLLRRQLCDWLGAVNLSCEPVDWQPPEQITREKTPAKRIKEDGKRIQERKI